MPFSAMSPDGPVSLLGVDAMTLENMRKRNRDEACFTAKCCGAPVVIRTADGKAAHFVHKTVPVGCDGERGETPEHRRLKAVIAKEAQSTYEWDVETEAVERDPVTNKAIWRADVLATKPKGAVAFEVQLSHADFHKLRDRQARYKASRVRGLWFVRTKKGFPITRELPVFPVESTNGADWVVMMTRWDAPEMWAEANDGDRIYLAEFVRAALDGQLQWAPFENKPDTWIRGSIGYEPLGTCPGCERTVVRHQRVRARIAVQDTYPAFAYTPNFYRRQSNWFMPLVNAVWDAAKADVDKALRSADQRCCCCGASLKDMQPAKGARSGWISASFQLKQLPKPRFQTLEQDWLRRWAVLA